MPRYIVHKDGWYFEWSTVVDAAVTEAMTKDEFIDYYRQTHGELEATHTLPDRLARAEAKGTSAHDYDSADDVMRYNRMGPNEGSVQVKTIMKTVLQWRKKMRKDDDVGEASAKTA
jgi:hypothetical protein